MQIPGARKDPGTVTDEKHSIRFDLLAEASQQVRKSLATLFYVLGRFGWEDGPHQTETSFHRVQKIRQRNRLIEDRNSTRTKHFLAGFALCHTRDKDDFEIGIADSDLAHQLHTRDTRQEIIRYEQVHFATGGFKQCLLAGGSIHYIQLMSKGL